MTKILPSKKTLRDLIAIQQRIVENLFSRGKILLSPKFEKFSP